jgi:hypothetical protein
MMDSTVCNKRPFPEPPGAAAASVSWSPPTPPNSFAHSWRFVFVALERARKFVRRLKFAKVGEGESGKCVFGVGGEANG